MVSIMISLRNGPGLRRPASLQRAFSSTSSGSDAAVSLDAKVREEETASSFQRAFSSTSSRSDAAVSLDGQTQQEESSKFKSLNQETPYQLCFLRHGQSTWNRENIFIGWTDTPLTPDGVNEARVAGQMLQNSGIRFDAVHTSLLRRSIRTANLALMELGQEYLPVSKHWRLNERNYGSLVGKNKKEVVKIHGKDQVKRWRRSYDEPPPPMENDHPYHPALDPRYQQMLHEIPKSESLKDTLARSRVYWDEVLAPSLKQGRTLLVVGHENNLRSLIMRLEDIPKEDIINLSLPRAVPLAYRLDENLKPLDRMDGKLDEATGMLRGEWLGGDKAVAEILERDEKQVYDTRISKNLELCDDPRDNFNTWVNNIMTDGSADISKHEVEAHLQDQRAKVSSFQNNMASSTFNGVRKQQLNGVNGV